VEETGVPWENHRPVASRWQTGYFRESRWKGCKQDYNTYIYP
jgi:hypothetical protein